MIDLSLRHLRAFVVVAEERHFGRAAERLGLAQSAVSQQLRRLEDVVGAPLLVRTSRRVSLTPAGQALLAPAQRILAAGERAVLDARAAAAGELGTLVLGAQGVALDTVVPSLIKALGRRAPGLEVVIQVLSSEEQVDALMAGRLDLALVREVVPRHGLRVETIRAESVLAVLPADHPLAAPGAFAAGAGSGTAGGASGAAAPPALELAALAGEPFVLWPRAGAPVFHDALVAACRAAGFSPRVAHEVRGISSRLGLIAGGLGVGLEASSYAVLQHAGVVFRPLAGDPVRARVRAAWSTLHDPPARAVALAVLSELGDQQPHAEVDLGQQP